MYMIDGIRERNQQESNVRTKNLKPTIEQERPNCAGTEEPPQDRV